MFLLGKQKSSQKHTKASKDVKTKNFQMNMKRFLKTTASGQMIMHSMYAQI